MLLSILSVLGVVSAGTLVNALVWLICVGLVFYLLYWLIGFVGLPEPFSRVANVILAVAAVLILINVVMSLAGHPIYRW